MRHSLAALLTLTLSALAIAACSSATDDGDPSAPTDELRSVTFATLPVASAAPIVLAQEKGVFEAHGIDLQIEYVEAAAIVPGILSGKFEFGLLNAPAVIAARANSVPIKSVVTLSGAPADPADSPVQVVVPVDSEIVTAEDLVGKGVATDTLYQLPDLGMRGALIESGISPEDLDVVEIPFANMGAALEEGRVDAAVQTEPFGTILRNSGAVRDVLSTSYGQAEGTPQTVLISAEKLIAENPDLVTQFQTAMNEGIKYAIAHEDEYRAVLPTYTKLDAALASEIRFNPLSTSDSVEGWQWWADLLLEAEVIEEPANVEESFVPRPE